MKALLIMLMICCGLLQGCSHLKKPTPLETPAISTSTGPITEEDLGVPIYPNARADRNQSFTFQGDSTGTNKVETTSASLVTDDSLQQVKQFYQEKLGPRAHISEHKSETETLVDISIQKENRQIRIQAVPQANGHGTAIVILTQIRKE